MTSTMREDGVGRVVTNALGDTRTLTGAPTNGERDLYTSPAEVAILDDLAAIIKDRDARLEDLLEAEREAMAAVARVDRVRRVARALEERATLTREAFETLRKRPRS
jgi:hypothetical protein